jgi:hypothetical protein
LDKEEVIIQCFILSTISLITFVFEKEFKISSPWEYHLLSGFISPLMYGISRLKHINWLRFYSLFIFVLWLISVLLARIAVTFYPVIVAMKLMPIPFMLSLASVHAIASFYESLKFLQKIRYGLESIKIFIDSPSEITTEDVQQLKKTICASDIKDESSGKRVRVTLSSQRKYINVLFSLEEWMWERIDKSINIILARPGIYSPKLVSFSLGKDPFACTI